MPCMTPVFSSGPPESLRQNQRLLGADVFEHAQDFDLELFDAVAAEHGLADADHAGPHVLERHGRNRGEQEGGREDSRQ